MPTPWTSQPQCAVQIDRSTPANRAITTLIPFGSINKDLCTGNDVVFASGGSISAGQRGRSLRGNGAAAVASIPLDLSFTRIASISFWMYWDAFANDDQLAMEFTASTNTNNGGFHVDPNCASPVFGVFQVVTSDAGAIYGASCVRPSGAAWHHYSMVLDRNTPSQALQALYIDSIPQSLTNRSTFYSTPSNFANSTLYFLSRAGSSLFAAGNIQNFVIRAGYKASASDALAEYTNPWSIFAPLRRPWERPAPKVAASSNKFRSRSIYGTRAGSRSAG